MIKYTQSNITSHQKGNLYAPKGVQVTLIHVTGHVAIFEYLGERYPCRVDLLDDTPPHAEPAQTVKKLKQKDLDLLEAYERSKL